MADTLIYLLKKCDLQKLLTFFQQKFSKNTCELDIVLTRTVNILTTNDLVKLMMLWTTGPRAGSQWIYFPSAISKDRLFWQHFDDIVKL